MRFLAAACLLNMKKLLSGKMVLTSMCFLPIIVVLCGLLLSRGGAPAAVKVGVCYDASDKLAANVYADVADSGMVTLTTFTPSEAEELKRLVATGDLACGYILPNELGARMKQNDYRALFTVVTPPGAGVSAITNEMVYTAVLRAASPYVTSGVLARYMDADYDEAFNFVSLSLDAYHDMNIFVRPDSFYENAGAAEADDSAALLARRVVNGVCGLFVILFLVLMMPMFVAEKETNGLAALTPAQRGAYAFSVFLVLFGTVLAAGLSAYGLAFTLFPALIGSPGAVLPAFVLFAAAASATALCGVAFLNKPGLVYAGFTFIALLHLFLGGVLIDIGELSPLFGKVTACFLTTYFLNAVLFKDVAAYAVLFCCLAAGLALAVWLSVYNRIGGE